LPILSQRLNVHNKRALSSPPTIAVDAADKPLSVTIKLNHWLVASLALHVIDSSV